MELPARMKLRMVTPLPKCTQSRILRLDPRQHMPYILVPEPKREKLLKLKFEPKLTWSPIDKLDPIQ
jgi:hypothetical protein